MSTSIDISTNEIVVTPSDSVVVETNQKDVCVQPYTDIEVVGVTKEYAIIGDAIFASQNIGEAPQWLTSIIDSVIGTALDTSLTDLAQAQRDLVRALEELGIANNNYTEMVNIDTRVDSAISTRLAALNANIENANATIAELQITKVSATEASAIALDVISSSLNDTAAGTIGGTVSQLNSSISTLAGNVSSTRTLVESRYGELNNSVMQAYASIVELQTTKVSADEASAVAVSVISSSLNSTAEGTIGGTITALSEDLSSDLSDLSGGLSDLSDVVGTLSQSLANSEALIAELETTKITEDEAKAVATDILVAAMADDEAGSLGSALSTLTNSVSTVVSSVDDVTTELGNVYDELTGKLVDANNSIIDANNSIIDANSSIADLRVTVSSAFAYNAVLLVGDNYYRSGFGLQTSVVSGGSGTIEDPYNSEFWINAQNFVLTDPISNSKVLMNSDGLYFQNASGATTRYLQSVNVFQNHPNNKRITLTNVKHVPSIVMGPGNMPVYRAANSSQDQSFVFEVIDVDNKINTDGTYAFTPKAELRLSSGIIGGTLSGGFSNSNTTSYSNPYTASTTLSGVTLNFTIGSTRGTGTSSTYYYRRCVVTVQTSADGVNYTNRTSTTINFGASLSTTSSSVTYTGSMAAGTRIRLMFAYSDAGGTFTSGTVEYDYNQSVVTDNTQRTITASATGAGGSDSKTLTPSMSYSTPSGWSVYNVVYTLEYSYYVSSAGSNSNAIASGNDNLFYHRVDNGSSSGNSGLTNWVSKTRTKSSFSTSHIRANATAYAGFSGDSATAKVSYRNVKATIYIRKVKTNSTTASNSASSLTYSANASSGVVLSTGTLNIITVE